MERLTKYQPTKGGIAYVLANNTEQDVLQKLAAYEDSGLEPNEIRNMMVDWIVWKQAETDGRLVILPCKIGDTVYRISWDNSIEEGHVSMLQQKNNGLWKFRFSNYQISYDNDISALGKTIFLTREAAEEKLREGSDSNG